MGKGKGKGGRGEGGGNEEAVIDRNKNFLFQCEPITGVWSYILALHTRHGLQLYCPKLWILATSVAVNTGFFDISIPFQ